MTAIIVCEPWRVGQWKNFLALSRDREGWWLNVKALGDDRWGPWPTRGEAVEVRRSYLRNAISKPWLAGLKRQAVKRRKFSRGGAKARRAMR